MYRCEEVLPVTSQGDDRNKYRPIDATKSLFTSDNGANGQNTSREDFQEKSKENKVRQTISKNDFTLLIKNGIQKISLNEKDVGQSTKRKEYGARKTTCRTPEVKQKITRNEHLSLQTFKAVEDRANVNLPLTFSQEALDNLGYLDNASDVVSSSTSDLHKFCSKTDSEHTYDQSPAFSEHSYIIEDSTQNRLPTNESPIAAREKEIVGNISLLSSQSKPSYEKIYQYSDTYLLKTKKPTHGETKTASTKSHNSNAKPILRKNVPVTDIKSNASFLPDQLGTHVKTSHNSSVIYKSPFPSLTELRNPIPKIKLNPNSKIDKNKYRLESDVEQEDSKDNEHNESVNVKTEISGASPTFSSALAWIPPNTGRRGPLCVMNSKKWEGRKCGRNCFRNECNFIPFAYKAPFLSPRDSQFCCNKCWNADADWDFDEKDTEQVMQEYRDNLIQRWKNERETPNENSKDSTESGSSPNTRDFTKDYCKRMTQTADNQYRTIQIKSPQISPKTKKRVHFKSKAMKTKKRNISHDQQPRGNIVRVIPFGKRNVRHDGKVELHHRFARLWSRQPAPGETPRNNVRNGIKARTIAEQKHIEETHLSSRRPLAYVPITYVAPTSKKRQALRWRVRSAMEQYVMPHVGLHPPVPPMAH